jgi:hypothetical protein
MSVQSRYGTKQTQDILTCGYCHRTLIQYWSFSYFQLGTDFPQRAAKQLGLKLSCETGFLAQQSKPA